MSTAVKRPVSVKQAEAMWEDLKGLFVNAEKKIVEIIEAKAWEPLGYDSFAEAWQARMTGVRLSSEELRAHVVYAMFDDGLTDDSIVKTLGVGSGVADAQVKVLKRQKLNGVPAEHAKTIVRSHVRKRPNEPQTLHVRFPADEYNEFKRIAAVREVDVVDVAQQAIRDAFAGLK